MSYFSSLLNVVDINYQLRITVYQILVSAFNSGLDTVADFDTGPILGSDPDPVLHFGPDPPLAILVPNPLSVPIPLPTMVPICTNMENTLESI
ncbi:hypothetical protein EVAR_93385_1 [Eumeta japonica]|uniref:Uncharacterized protein n=1 Tax=Eumeta variegata TaxID=151549 RepID=A0A4C1UPR9_EUMVA|nr:hypothetical protein EVAR_93385_1 [Eumeta japonica]